MDNKNKCILCEKDENQVPMILLSYKGKQLSVCPQHMPVLIHDPQKLVGLLDGAENFTAG